MDNVRSKIWLIALLLGAVVSSLLLYRLNHTQIQVAENFLHYPDVFMTDIKATQFNVKGRIDLYNTSPALQHYPNGTINFTRPQITILTTSGSPWQVNADYGQTHDGSHVLHFWQDVQVTRVASAANDAIDIKTPALSYDMQQKLATSGQSVTVMQPPTNKMEAVGFRAYLDKNYVDLLANVRGVYVSQTNSTQSSTH